MFVGDIRQKRLQFYHEGLGLALADMPYHADEQAAGQLLAFGDLHRQELLQKAALHFFIGKTQVINAQLIIAIDGEIAALVKNGQRVAFQRVQRVENIGPNRFIGQIFQIESRTVAALWYRCLKKRNRASSS